MTRPMIGLLCVLATLQAPARSIAGVWELNKELSDAPQTPAAEEGRGRGDGRRGNGGMRGGFGGGGFGRGRGADGADREALRRRADAVRAILEPADRLTIVETESMVIVTTGDGRTTRLSPNGEKVKDESTGVERRSRRENGALVTEITGAAGKITETYALDAEHHRLTLTVRAESSRSGSDRTIRRVYDARP